ncbi:MAG: hypothetical protein FJ386_13375 [Verrucomicrobia bacterium]|nr:hypothetical protein [Verrucomicrobiota bacterium]
MATELAEFARTHAGWVLPLLCLSCLAVLVGLFSIQRRQLRALQTWEEERKRADQQRLEQSRAHLASEQAERDARLQREKQVQQSRQLMANAIATLQQLKRHSE